MVKVRIIEIIISFIAQTQFDDLRNDVTHEMKRVVLDSIGCAVVGLSTERGNIAI